MRSIRTMKIMPALLGLLSALLLSMLAIPLGAQTATDSQTRHVPLPGYDKMHEIILAGNIEDVVPHAAAGSPAGMHLLVAGSQGTTDVHLGPYITKETQEALHSGTPVEIVGAMETIRGKSYLLARQVTFDGRTITVRSQNGFLVMEHPSHMVGSSTEKVSQIEFNGGAR